MGRSQAQSLGGRGGGRQSPSCHLGLLISASFLGVNQLPAVFRENSCLPSREGPGFRTPAALTSCSVSSSPCPPSGCRLEGWTGSTRTRGEQGRAGKVCGRPLGHEGQDRASGPRVCRNSVVPRTVRFASTAH